MAADQNLIRAVSAMGPSKFRDDSGWIKAIGAIGKYVAVKQAIFKEANQAFDETSGFAEDVDVESLKIYQQTSDANLKTIKNVPAFMPKYKKAVASQTAILKELELNKTMSSKLAKRKAEVAAAKLDNMSNYRRSKYAVLYADLVSDNYTHEMSPEGGKITGSNGVTVLISDLLDSSKPHLKSESKTNNDAIKTLVMKLGAEAKIKGQDINDNTKASMINDLVNDMWSNGNDNTTILYTTGYEINGGETTFMDYYAKQKGIDSMATNFVDLEDDALDAALSLAKDDLWENGNQKEIKAAYKKFLLDEVVSYHYDINNSPETDPVTGKPLPNYSRDLGYSMFDADSKFIKKRPSDIKLKKQELNNLVEGAVVNYWTGAHNEFRAEPMSVSETARNSPLGWQLYQNGVRSENPLYNKPITAQEALRVFNISPVKSDELP